MKDKIVIKGARVNNLKNIDIELPRNKMIIMTGLSGSGKTSLAFDTIYAEGQRRYVESLSAYARQFLGNFEKPDVDSIEGLSPSISIDQKTTNNNPRSTVGTVTEIYDYLRLLYARIGVPYCPKHGIAVSEQSVEEMTNKILEYEIGTKIEICSPVVHGEKGTFKDKLDEKLSSIPDKCTISNNYSSDLAKKWESSIIFPEKSDVLFKDECINLEIRSRSTRNRRERRDTAEGTVKEALEDILNYKQALKVLIGIIHLIFVIFDLF